VSVQGITIDLTALPEVNWANCIKNTRRVASGWVSNLNSMTGVVQEVAGTGLAHQPVDRGLLRVSGCQWNRVSRIVRECYGH